MTILSIQSSVCYGVVGNNAATIPLLFLGHKVNTIHTVFFSNHTGYPTVKGTKLTGDQFQDIIDGLTQNNLLSNYQIILSGYVGNASTLLALKNTITLLKQSNPTLLYIMDPVMGDNDYMYVPVELIEIYKSMLTLADIITPNKYELELLTGMKINSIRDAEGALKVVHLWVEYAVMTSMEINGELVLIGSCRGDVIKQFKIVFPKVNENFTGTGDTFTALMLGYFLNGPRDYKGFVEACEKSVSVLNVIITWTYSKIEKIENFDELPRETKMCMRELESLECRKAIENPVVKFQATGSTS